MSKSVLNRNGQSTFIYTKPYGNCNYSQSFGHWNNGAMIPINNKLTLSAFFVLPSLLTGQI